MLQCNLMLNIYYFMYEIITKPICAKQDKYIY